LGSYGALHAFEQHGGRVFAVSLGSNMSAEAHFTVGSR
jgi:hypothetical protein